MLNSKVSSVATFAAIIFALFLFADVSSAEASPPNPKASNHIGQSGPAEPTPEVREAAATEVIANYTRKLAVLTGVLAVVGLVTSGLSLWQILLARDEFNATHRPKIITRSFEPATSDGKASVAFVFVNVGAGEATVTEIGSCVSSNSNPGKIFLVEPGSFPIVLASGEKRQWFVVDDHLANYVGTYIDPTTAISGGFLIGYIKYSDAAGRNRETGFCRKFNTDNNRWVRQTESELEYED